MAVICDLWSQKPCEIKKCIQRIKGLKGTSQSPTDMWQLFLTPRSTFYEENHRISIDKLFLKWSISPESWQELYNHIEPLLEFLGKDESDWFSYIMENAEDHKKDIEGVRYEINFYTTIIKRILDNKYSPHFVRIYGNYEGDYTCSYGDLLDILEEAKIPDYAAKLRRNLLYIFTGIKNRPSISDDLSDKDKNILKFIDEISHNTFNNIILRSKYIYTLTQYIEPDYSMSFHDYIDKISAIVDKDSKNNIIIVLLMFQIVQTCYCLYKSKATHNDLHLGNIFITERNEHPQNISYIIPDSSNSEVKSRYNFKQITRCARIFDFDRSYAEELGDNPMIENDSELCMFFSQCNKVILGKDIAKVACYLVHMQRYKWLLWIITDRKGPHSKFWENYTKDNCYLQGDDGISLSDEIFNSIYPCDKILSELYAIYVSMLGPQIFKDDDVVEIYNLP